MKANNGSGNIIERDEWETPMWLFYALNKQYNFTFDCCATLGNAKCEFFSDDFIKDYEFVPKIKCGWMNPPFSKAKEMFIHFFEVVKNGVAIYRSDNLETAIWQDIILKNADWIFFPKGRINYVGLKGKGSRFPSALIGKNLKHPKYLDGVTMMINKY